MKNHRFLHISPELSATCFSSPQTCGTLRAMSNQKDPLEQGLDDLLGNLQDELEAEIAPAGDESGATDSFYEGFEPKTLSVEQPIMHNLKWNARFDQRLIPA